MGKQINRENIIDYDEKYATVTAAVATAGPIPVETEIFNFRVKPGKKPYLSFVANSVQAGGGDFITFVLKINNSPFYPFDGSLNQWAPPESNYDLPVPFELPVGCTVSVVARNSDTSTTYASTARVRIVYIDFENLSVF